MSSLNTRRPILPLQGGVPPQRFEPSNTLRTHEGAPAAAISPELALRRSVCSCLLWENNFYESGKEVASRIAELAQQVIPKVLADLAYDARSHFNLRHVPLLLCSLLAKTGSGSRLVGDTIRDTIQRADELSEFLAVYAKVNGVAPNAVKKKLSAQVKCGLALAFQKFDEYQLAKYFSPAAEAGQPIKARDVMFMVHPKPRDETQAALWKALIAGEVKSADTWEVSLSSGKGKKETFERLLNEEKLGYLALLRNLRNMTEANVDQDLIEQALAARKGARRVLPFRYVAAARACPQMAQAVNNSLLKAIADLTPLLGRTIILVDVSGSMSDKLSAKSDLTRMDAAAALAAVINGNVRVFTFSNHVVEVQAERGLSGISAVIESQPHQGTYLGQAVASLFNIEADRLIVITDEQSHDYVPDPACAKAYMINVAPYSNGIGYGERWTHIDGFSEQIIRFIHEFESLHSPTSNAIIPPSQ